MHGKAAQTEVGRQVPEPVQQRPRPQRPSVRASEHQARERPALRVGLLLPLLFRATPECFGNTSEIATQFLLLRVFGVVITRRELSTHERADRM